MIEVILPGNRKVKVRVIRYRKDVELEWKLYTADGYLAPDTVYRQLSVEDEEEIDKALQKAGYV